MEINKGNIIKRQHFGNGMEIVLQDHSRRMSADRWIVELHCVVYIPIDESYWHIAAGEDSQILADIKKKLGHRLVHTFIKKRIFVEEQRHDQLLQDMLQQVYRGMMEYLKKPNFPHKLFKRQYHATRQKIMLQQAMSHVVDV